MSCPLVSGTAYDLYLDSNYRDSIPADLLPKGLYYDTELGGMLIFREVGSVDEYGVKQDRLWYISNARVALAVQSV